MEDMEKDTLETTDNSSKQKKALPAEDLAVFCDEIAMMLRVGLNLPDGLGAIASHLESREARELVGQMKEKLEQYTPLSQVLSEAGVFPRQLVQMAGIGEQAGTLEQVMTAMAAHYRREDTIRRQIRSAVLYPIVTLIMMGVVLTVLTTQVFPVFTQMFQTLGAGMSQAAEAAVALGNLFSWIVAGMAGLLVIVGIAVWIVGLTSGGRERLTGLSARLPVFRKFSMKISAARFCDVFSMLLAGGYHAEDALEQIAEMLPDPTVRQRVLQCRLDLQQGVPQGEALVNTGLFTGLQNGLIAVACQSGALDTTLRSMAEENLQEVDRMIQRAVSLIEPVMIGLTAVIIGSILLSVMLPLTGMIASLG